jgi:transcriptional regulator with XRE-family HTH domain
LFADNLRKLRKGKGLTQKQLAKIINVSTPAVSQYEQGKATPRRDTLISIAKYFGVTVAYLEGTTSIEDIENMLNSNYAADISVRDLLDMCFAIEPENRGHFLYITSLMAKDNNGNED